MNRLSSWRPLAAASVAAILGACAPAVSVPAPATALTTGSGPTTLLVRLGTDTVAMEQYTRTASQMDGILVTRAPFTAISRYTVQLGSGNAAESAEYSSRRGDGTIIPAGLKSLSVRYRADSVTMMGHREGADTVRTIAAHGMLLPYLGNSYALFELAIARLLATGRDSADFALVPLNLGVRNALSLPLRLFGVDSLRINWFGSPLYGRRDGRGNLLGMDGRQSTVKVRVERVAGTDLEALARRWSARDAVNGAVGVPSPRDTVRATIGRAHVSIDYGRPSLRGRDVWVNGVLGDTIWRTGANAATQLTTDSDLMIGRQSVPAGTYSLWTLARRNDYQLIVNRQAGQWGTEYHSDRDLLRVPLHETDGGVSTERFTVAITPQNADGAALVMSWGRKQLSVPITTK